MLRFLAIAVLFVVWSSTAAADPAGGRITFVGAVVTPTCVVTGAPAVAHRQDVAARFHTCVSMHDGTAMPIASYTRTVAPLTSSWTAHDVLLRTLARRLPAAQRSRASVVTRIYQ